MLDELFSNLNLSVHFLMYVHVILMNLKLT